jgi:hypothetical protein
MTRRSWGSGWRNNAAVDVGGPAGHAHGLGPFEQRLNERHTADEVQGTSLLAPPTVKQRRTPYGSSGEAAQPELGERDGMAFDHLAGARVAHERLNKPGLDVSHPAIAEIVVHDCVDDRVPRPGEDQRIEVEPG